jgi:hypothetical protein
VIFVGTNGQLQLIHPLFPAKQPMRSEAMQCAKHTIVDNRYQVGEEQLAPGTSSLETHSQTHRHADKHLLTRSGERITKKAIGIRVGT